MKKIEQLKNVADALAKAQELGQYPADWIAENVKNFGKLKNRTELEEVGEHFEEVGSDYRPDFEDVEPLAYSIGKNGLNGVLAVELLGGRVRLIKMTSRRNVPLWYNAAIANLFQD